MILTRRRWLKGAVAIAAASSIAPALFGAEPEKSQIVFTTITQKCWPLLQKVGEEHDVTVELRVTNSSKADVNISLFDTLTPTITFPDGKSQSLGLRRRETIRPSPIALAAGKSETVKFDARVYWIKRGDGMAAAIHDKTGGIWTIDSVPEGKYTLAFRYLNKEVANCEGKQLWIGEAEAAPVSFQVAPLK